jgi:hypothetical protein
VYKASIPKKYEYVRQDIFKGTGVLIRILITKTVNQNTMLKKVTFTGADDSVLPEDLFQVSKDHPIVEWGILLSKDRMGQPRYPSKEWLLKLADEYDSLTEKYGAIDLSLHLCGEWARGFVMGYKEEFIDALQGMWSHFKRVQLNLPKDVEYSPLSLTSSLMAPGKQFIFQVKGYEDRLFNYVKTFKNVAALFDRSGGKGISPDLWPGPPEMYCGWAGGLGPDNLMANLEIFHELQDHKIGYWVDMETKVRSRVIDGEFFDMDKVIQCLEIVKEFKAKGCSLSQDDIGVYSGGIVK